MHTLLESSHAHKHEYNNNNNTSNTLESMHTTLLVEYSRVLASVKRTLIEENIVFAQRQGAPKLCVYFIYSPLNH